MASINDIDITNVGNDFMYVKITDKGTCVEKLDNTKAEEVANIVIAATDVKNVVNTVPADAKTAADAAAKTAAAATGDAATGDAAAAETGDDKNKKSILVEEGGSPDADTDKNLLKASSLFAKLSLFYSGSNAQSGGAKKQAGGRRVTKKQRMNKNKSLKKMTKKELIRLLKGQ